MMQKELITKKDYATVGEEISHELAGDMIKAYQHSYPETFTGVMVGRNIIEAILAQPGCVGLRFYSALNEKDQKTLVYVGVDTSGKDLVKKVVVLEDGKLSTVPAIVADRGNVWDDLVAWITGK
jgi:hypothetical protein